MYTCCQLVTEGIELHTQCNHCNNNKCCRFCFRCNEWMCDQCYKIRFDDIEKIDICKCFPKMTNGCEHMNFYLRDCDNDKGQFYALGCMDCSKKMYSTLVNENGLEHSEALQKVLDKWYPVALRHKWLSEHINDDIEYPNYASGM